MCAVVLAELKLHPERAGRSFPNCFGQEGVVSSVRMRIRPAFLGKSGAVRQELAGEVTLTQMWRAVHPTPVTVGLPVG